MSDSKEIRLALDPKILLNFFEDNASFKFGECRPFTRKKLIEELLDWFFNTFLDIKHIIQFIQISEDKITIKLESEYALQGGSKKDLDLTLTLSNTPGTIGATNFIAEGDDLDKLFATITSLKGAHPTSRTPR